MAILIRKVDGGYLIDVNPPHSSAVFQSKQPLSLQELIDASNRLEIHTTDFWDAAIEADPDLMKT